MGEHAGVVATEATGPPDDGSIGRAWRSSWFAGSPGWLFHLVLAVVAAPLLWAASTPAGGPILLWLGSGLVLSVAALVWGVRLVTWRISRPRRGATGSAWWFLLAPLCAAVLVGAVVVDVPLRTRWLLARPSLDRVVENAPPALEPDQPMAFEVPAVVGSYRVDRAVRVGDDIFVFVTSGSSRGAFLVAAGFAHLPTGPSPTMNPVDPGAERMEHRHLGGDWYAWAAYW